MNPLLPSTMVLALFVVGVLAVRQAVSPGAFVEKAVGLSDHTGKDADSSRLGAQFDRLARRLGPFGLRVFGERYTARMRHQLLKAGSPRGMSVRELLGRKVLTIILMVLLAIILLPSAGPLLALAVVVIGLVFHDAWLASVAHDRRTRIEKDLPDLLDVLAVTLTASIAFRPGLGRVAALTSGPLAEEIGTTLREMDFGVPRRRAFENLRYRNEGSEPVTDLVGGVLQAEELGVPLVEAIVDLTTDLRRTQEQSLRRRVSRVEARITAVMTLMVLPASVILIAVALFLRADIDFGAVLGA